LRVGSDKEFVPNLDKFGFVYIITNLRNGKAYIGCKQYLFYTRLREKESDWRTYTGSSKLLNEDIEKTGKKHFKFEAIAEYKNKRSLRYYELYYQMKYNVLAATLEGSEEHAYYNSRVGGKFYRPVESYQDPEWRKKQSEANKKRFRDPEERKKLSKAQKKRWEDPEERKKMSESMKNSETFQKAMRDPEHRKKLGEREHYKDPKWRKKQSENAKKQFSDPEMIRRQSESAKERFRDPEERKKMSEAQKKRRLKEKKENAKAKET